MPAESFWPSSGKRQLDVQQLWKLAKGQPQYNQSSSSEEQHFPHVQQIHVISTLENFW